MKKLLSVTDLNHQAGGFRLRVNAFELSAGESVLLVGPSGSGKTTFLNLITGLDLLNGTRTALSVEGQDLTSLSASKRDRLRGEAFGVIFQSLNLLPFASLSDNINASLLFAPERQKRAERASAEQLLDQLGLGQVASSRKADSLSVGQQQRVAIARALVGSPPIILADEPTSALDARSRDRFMDLLFTAFDRARQGLLVVSHDMSIAERFDRVVNIEELAR